MKIHSFITLALLVFSAGTGCNMVNPVEEIPTYIQVDSFQFLPSDTAYTAGISHDIKSVFVLYDGKNIGAFDLPARIPILAAGSGTLQLFPGVNNTGLYTYQWQYPHYSPFTTQLTADAGNTTRVQPTTGYTQAARFLYTEDFERTADFVSLAGASMDSTSAPGKVINGYRSGLLKLDVNGGTTSVVSNGSFVYSNTSNSNPTLEIDYRGDALLRIGLISATAGQFYPNYIFSAYPSAQTTKLYLSILSSIGSFKTPNGTYRILLEAVPANGQTSGSVTIDDVKIIAN